MILTGITPCARAPGANLSGLPGASVGVTRGSYGSRLLQSGLMSIYVTFWVWSAMQSTPETPGFIEVATKLSPAGMLTDRVFKEVLTNVPHNTSLIG